MTYCVGMHINNGLVFMSDTRTNSGVDNISSFTKMHTWEVEGDRSLTLLTAGNLATTQAVVSLLDERSKQRSERDPSIFAAKSMFQVATLVGDTLREVIAKHANNEAGLKASATFNASIILGGQIAEGSPRLFLIYPEGNFIEAGTDTPFFQIGETKYGRPILVRAYDPEMSFEEAIKLLLVSFDSTLKANLSVGLPLDVNVYTANSLSAGRKLRITADDPYFSELSDAWGLGLREALKGLAPFTF
jgi:putative proteasome-type protease